MRRALFAVAVIAAVALVAEGGARIALRFLAPGATPDTVAEVPPHEAGGATDAEAARLLTAEFVLHPFLGFVQRQRPVGPDRFGLHDLPISEFGFVDDKPPLVQRAPGRFVVAVTGGSVSLYLANETAQTLVRTLAQAPELAGREIVLVRLALSGFKQPQQLATIAYLLSLGGEFDAIVNVDGFNEVALWPAENAPLHVFPAYPRAWPYQVDAFASPARREAFAAQTFLTGARQRWASWLLGSDFARSRFMGLVWLAGDRWLARRAADASSAFRAASQETPSSYAATGPPTTFATEAEMLDSLVSLWQRSSLQLHRLSLANGIRYVHVLQPNQYDEGSKPLGPEERRIAIRASSPYESSVRLGYPRLRAAGERLRQSGVDFVDLSGLFRSIETPLYRDDCCHLNAEGTRRLAEAVAAAVRAVPAPTTPAH